ncbi:hypothetical protein RMCBS344292_04748 [Rhizopus microsporus]|nr:hypothetical protein RMCBS344292_04748 [Rhizopus microsporus]
MSTYNCVSIPQSTFYDTLYSIPTGRSLSCSSSSTSESHWEDDESTKRSSKKGVSTFISKLFSIVNDAHNQHLIAWNNSGTSFFIYNATRFSQDILPIYFKHSNYSSFVRQLNMYGFHKINKSPRGQRGSNEYEVWEFSHKNFQRDNPTLLEDIKRKTMDSELLRRENGDVHASLATMQQYQADLLRQFKALQENYSNLLQNMEEMKKTQDQQQATIRKLLDYATQTSSIKAHQNMSDMTVMPTYQTISQSNQKSHGYSAINQDMWCLSNFDPHLSSSYPTTDFCSQRL